MTFTQRSFSGNGSGWTMVHAVNNRERIPATIPVKASTSDAIRTITRLTIPVDPGDMLTISGRFRVTNDATPTKILVGIGAWYDGYDCDDGVAYADKTWIRASSSPEDWLGTLTGGNVDPIGGVASTHHLQIGLCSDRWLVPSDWPAGHTLCVAIRAGAASSQSDANGGTNVLKIDDGYTTLDVERWVPNQ